MEQDRWMQRLLMALKSDSTSQTRLSQYRFSSCDFVPVVNQVSSIAASFITVEEFSDAL